MTDKPVGIFLTHGGGGKAVESVKSICRSFKFRLACAPVMVLNRPDDEATQKLARWGRCWESWPWRSDLFFRSREDSCYVA